jgi:hypothetical protein
VEAWTVRESLAGRYRLFINFGGKPYWCMFDYAVSPTHGNELAAIEITADADNVTQKWFPDIRQGMLRGFAEERERGREFVGIRIEVRKVHEHPIDTTARGCERYGASFVRDLLSSNAVPVVA